MIVFSSRRRASRQAADRLYASAAGASRHPELYLSYDVPDTLQGRFEMLALHVFALVHRLMHEPGDDPELARLVSESMVVDMDSAFREMGVGDITVPKRMKTLYRSFGGRVSAYAEALTAGEAALAAAIERNVFPDAPRPAAAEALARHLTSTLAALRAADLADLRRGEVRFPEPSQVDQPGARP